jgi:hypothetical protein
MPVPETSPRRGYTSITPADETILASKDLIEHLPMPAENPDVAGNERESALCRKEWKSGKSRQLTLHAHQDAPAQRATSIPGVLQTPSSPDLRFGASSQPSHPRPGNNRSCAIRHAMSRETKRRFLR